MDAHVEELRLAVTRPPAVEARELYRFYHIGDDETLALRGVSVSAAEGEMVAVVGPSGSGKSTLIACMTGLDEPDGGVVYVAGERITRRPERTPDRTALPRHELALQDQPTARPRDAPRPTGSSTPFRPVSRQPGNR